MITDAEYYALQDQLRWLSARVRVLEAEVRELRALVTPLDPGSLPAPQAGDAHE